MRYEYDGCRLCRAPLTNDDRQQQAQHQLGAMYQNMMQGQLCGSLADDVCQKCRTNGNYDTWLSAQFQMAAAEQRAAMERDKDNP